MQTQSKARGVELFVISFLILFIELACIRFFPAYLKLLGYFANTVLLASFLGMSVGCLAARRRVTFIHFVPALFLLAVTLTALLWSLAQFRLTQISLKPEVYKTLIYFGAEMLFKTPVHLPLEAVLSVIFLLVALIFVGLGQVMGMAFDGLAPIKAYIINISGSLAGVAAFTVMSALSLPPVWWFGISFLLLTWWLRGGRQRLAGNLLLLMASFLVIHFLDSITVSPSGKDGTHWSPYYKVRYFISTTGEAARLSITVNEIGHQFADSASSPRTLLYSVPYALLKGCGHDVKKVLIIGAGAGNDAAAALVHGARSVDAVEIDPFILQLGRRWHPDRPYHDPRVRLFNDDGRSFLRKTKQRYDLIVYGLVDSLTLMSTYSSVRLETYLFTLESFQEVKRHLKEDGVFVIYNFFRENWLALRIARMLKDVFGEQPLVFTFPPIKTLSLESESPPAMFSIFISGHIEPLRRRFKGGEVFLLKPEAKSNRKRLGEFANEKPRGNNNTQPIAPVELVATPDPALPTDDRPFLYLRERTIPSYLLRCMGIVLAISVVMLLLLGRGELSGRFSPHFFFLGAAFLLLETRSVTTLALLYGSTWRVNAIVFFSILLMILLANLYVVRHPTERFGRLYAFLSASLLINHALPPQVFLGWGSLAKTLLPPLVAFLPILAAALVFANSFRRSTQSSADFGWNVAGAMFGGLCENLSLLIGYRHLLLVAMAFYLLSALTIKRR